MHRHAASQCCAPRGRSSRLSSCSSAGCGAGRSYRPRRACRARRATGTPRSSTIARRCRKIPTAPTTRSRSSARCSTRRSGTSTRRGCSKRAGSSRTRCASTAAPASSTRRTARSPARCIEIERRIRDQAEAAASNARRSSSSSRRRGRSPAPLLNPASRDPIDVVFNNASLRDILNSIGMSTGINVTYDRDYQDRSLHGAAARRDARAGAQPDPRGQPAVLQGDQRAHDHGDPRQRRRSARSTRSR